VCRGPGVATLRSRVITGTLAVVNKRVVPPTVAPHETTRPNRPVPPLRCGSVFSSCPRGTARSALPRRSWPPRRWRLIQFHHTQGPDDEDLLVVDGHLRNPEVEVVGKPACEPGLISALCSAEGRSSDPEPHRPRPTSGRSRVVPRAGEGRADAHEMSLNKDYIITCQIQWSPRRRSSRRPAPLVPGQSDCQTEALLQRALRQDVLDRAHRHYFPLAQQQRMGCRGRQFSSRWLTCTVVGES